MLVELRASRAAPKVQPVRRRVALVAMPAQIPSYPSLALATLAAELRRRGHHVDVHYLNIESVRAVGLRTYQAIVAEDSWVKKFAEWLFSHPDITPGAADAATMRAFLKQRRVGTHSARLADVDFDGLRKTFDTLIDRWAEELPWSSYDVVGFTVMFQQLNASLRLAHAIKRRAPKTRVVLGGCGLEDPIGGAVFARYPFLDAVFSGYAERSFPAWLQALPPRAESAIIDGGVENLDELPTPEFDDYLDALRRHGLLESVTPRVLFESSRGCWYGEKQHCTFCGFNGLQMRYRHKSGERVFDEVRALSRYGIPVWTSDTILPLEFFDTLFPRLEREGVRYDAFYEIKSNSRRQDLETLARVGIRRLQPGIESFSTKILQHMKKGVTGIQNVWFLRAAEELGVGLQWNVLWGFPGEAPEEYAKMASLFPKLSHLQPPYGCDKILLLRHSPNHSRAAEYGFADVRPFPSYELAFGPHPHLEQQAYLFDYTYADGRNPYAYTREVSEQAALWQGLSGRPLAPRCEVWLTLGLRLLLDTRRKQRVGRAWPRLHLLNDDEWALLQALESPIPRARLEREWTGRGPLGPLLERFLRQGWAYEADERIVRLVVVREHPSPVAEVRRVLGIKSKILWRKLMAYA